MGKRFFYGFSMFFALMGLLAADYFLGVTGFFYLFCTCMCVAGVFELGRMFKFRGLPLDTGLLVFTTLALFGYVQFLSAPPHFGAFARLWADGALPRSGAIHSLFLLSPLAVCVFFPLVGLTHRDVTNIGPRIANNLGVFLYLIFPIAAILWLTRVHGAGPWLLYFLLAASRLGDVGAYLTGRAIGRHKLIPYLSAAKTIEGAIGGLAFSAVGGVAVLLWANWARGGLDAVLTQWWHGALLGGFVGIAAQSGDLVESAFKRAAGIKDSGHLVPTFGGVMDLMDNFMLTGPLLIIILALL